MLLQLCIAAYSQLVCFKEMYYDLPIASEIPVSMYDM